MTGEQLIILLIASVGMNTIATVFVGITLYIKIQREVSLRLPVKSVLRKVFRGAIINAIDAHGPITKQLAESVAKRATNQLLGGIRNDDGISSRQAQRRLYAVAARSVEGQLERELESSDE